MDMNLSYRHIPGSSKTTAGSRTLLLMLAVLLLVQAGCARTQPTAEQHEQEALKAGKPSQFLIHLTDLSDGTPVEKAEVTLTTRAKDGSELSQTKARVGKVTGIYVADVAIANGGDYDIEFHVKNAKLDERIALKDFKVE